MEAHDRLTMISFGEFFRKSKGQPVIYNGQVIQMVDRLSMVDGQQFKVIFKSVNSDWRQGINLSTDGSFEVNGQTVKKSIVLWNDTAPQEVVIQIKSKKGECLVKNVWDTGDGVIESWHNGAAMIVEISDSGRLYKCNDGRPNDDFDDLVFCIELISN